MGETGILNLNVTNNGTKMLHYCPNDNEILHSGFKYLIVGSTRAFQWLTVFNSQPKVCGSIPDVLSTCRHCDDAEDA